MCRDLALLRGRRGRRDNKAGAVMGNKDEASDRLCLLYEDGLKATTCRPLATKTTLTITLLECANLSIYWDLGVRGAYVCEHFNN